MSRRWWWGVCWGLAVLMPVQAEIEQPLQRLQQTLERYQTLEGRFEQRLLSTDGEVLEKGNGSFALSRPGRFRWDHESPYPQQVVGDGRRVWFYDPELEQVVVREQRPILSSTPIGVLVGDRRLDQIFRLLAAGEESERWWIEVVPTQRMSEVERMRLVLQEDRLESIEVVDPLGQRSQIHFLQLQQNRPLAPSLFEFVVPSGVDQIGEP